MDTLRTDIIVALCTLRRPLRNKLGGRGVSRRREDIAAIMAAEQIARMIARNHRFKKDEQLASVKDLERYISGAIQKLPDALVYQFASKSQMESEPAAEEITRLLLEAMQRDWLISYEEPARVSIKANFGPWVDPRDRV